MADETHRINIEINQTSKGSALAKLADSMDQVRRSIERQEAVIRDTNRAMQAYAEGAAEAANKSNRLQEVSVAIGSLMSDALQNAAGAVWDFVKESKTAFEDFETDATRALTILEDKSAEGFEGMTNQVKDFALETGRLTGDVLPAVYTASSLGIGDDNIFSVLSTASKAAQADADSTTRGLGDLNATLETGLQIMNAYQQGPEQLSAIYDKLFKGIELGALTMDDFNAGLSQVTSVAGETGVRLDDIIAAMVAMTKQGDTFEESAELLSLMLTQLATSGTKISEAFDTVTGKSFRQFILEGGNLADAMQALRDYSEETGVALTDLLGGGSNFFRDSQATRGALELTNFIETMADALGEIEDSEGTMQRAFEMNEENTVHTANEMAAALDVLKVHIGEMIANKTPFLEMVQGLTKFLQFNVADSGQAEIQTMVDGIIASATSADQLEDALSRVGAAAGVIGDQTLFSDNWFAGLFMGETQEDLERGTQTLIENLAAQSDSYEEFVQRMRNAGIAIEDITPTLILDEDGKMIENTEQLSQSFIKIGDNVQDLATVYSDAQAAQAALREEVIATGSAYADSYNPMLEQNAYVMGEELTPKMQAQIDEINNMTEAQRQQRAEDYAATLEEQAEALKNLAADMDAALKLTTSLADAEAAYSDLLLNRPDVKDDDYDQWVADVEAAKEDIVAANEAIAASYDQLALKAIIAQVASGQISANYASAFLSASGIVTDEAATMALEIAETEAQMRELFETFENLTPQNAAEAYLLLKSGLADSAEEASTLAEILDSETVEALTGAKTGSDEFYEAVDKAIQRYGDLPDLHIFTLRIITDGELPPLPGSDASGGTYDPGANSGQTFARGGYTGNRPRNQIVGGVHGDEFVLDSPTTHRVGVPRLQRLLDGADPGQVFGSTPARGAVSVAMSENNTYLVPDLTTFQKIQQARTANKRRYLKDKLGL